MLPLPATLLLLALNVITIPMIHLIIPAAAAAG